MKDKHDGQVDSGQASEIKQSKDSVNPKQQARSGSPARRKALAVGAVGAVAWKTPVLKSIVLPAHAQTSVTTTMAPATTAAPTTMAPMTNIVTMAPAAFGGTISFTI